VEVRVRATGLNFRDVLNVLGMYPGASGPPGVEFAGVVTRVGAGVTRLSPGDEVIGIGEGTFASHVTGPASAVSLKPRALTAVEAATIPLAFLTAEWGLTDLAELQPGERVLIHAAAGGVGQAAVHLALARGAEIFATAGSEEKRDHLRAQGVRHVFDSRSDEFVGGVLAATAGAGVDVVLNSLTGELLRGSLELVRPAGRFIEIGKAEILDPADVAARHPGVRYQSFDLGAILLERPDVFQGLFERVTARFDSGELKPLATRVYPAEEVVDAFRFMAQARHIGKVVVAAARPMPSDEPVVDVAGSYLVTGGGGGVGRAVAEWLVANGAGRVVLNGRSTPTAEVSSWMERLRETGASRLEWAPGDISSMQGAAGAVSAANSTEYPLRGVFHAAGVLDDALLLDQTRDRFATVMAPKVAGAWNLHALTRRHDLDRFVLFSSVAAMLGGPGQGSYAAANAFLDALAASRAQEGLPGLSVDWGGWAGAGMTERLGDRERRMLEQQGLSLLEPQDALEELGRLMATSRHAALVAEVDWKRVAAAARSVPPILADVLAADVAASGAAGRAPAERRIDIAAFAQLGAGERRSQLTSYVCATLASVLGIRGRVLEEDAEIAHLGFDSLMAMELRNRVEADLGILVPVAQMLGSGTPGELAYHILLAVDVRPEVVSTASRESFEF
jgi:NADPH:quinone reductase-like Zn-dependent oxidoreductase/acyl carrier protein